VIKRRHDAGERTDLTSFTDFADVLAEAAQVERCERVNACLLAVHRAVLWQREYHQTGTATHSCCIQCRGQYVAIFCARLPVGNCDARTARGPSN
jgi:hypothetical protein